jgi:hypothetical protein
MEGWPSSAASPGWKEQESWLDWSSQASLQSQELEREAMAHVSWSPESGDLVMALVVELGTAPEVCHREKRVL